MGCRWGRSRYKPDMARLLLGSFLGFLILSGCATTRQTSVTLEPINLQQILVATFAKTKNKWPLPGQSPIPGVEFESWSVRGLNPGNSELQIASKTNVKLVGQRQTLPGVGIPLAVMPAKNVPLFDKANSAAPVLRFFDLTAVAEKTKTGIRVRAVDPNVSRKVWIDGKMETVAVDLTAPDEEAIRRLHYQLSGFEGMLDAARKTRARLFFVEPYDPNKIPVLMIHGLGSAPSIWFEVIAELQQDPEVRRRYQFWLFGYASGLPFQYVGYLLRQQLEPALQKTGANDLIVFGHSMGGLVTQTLVTNSGTKLEKAVFRVPIKDLPISAEDKKMLKGAYVLHALPQIHEVVFLSTPHRGSDDADTGFSNFVSSLVRLPAAVAGVGATLIKDSSEYLVSDATKPQMPTGVDTLSPKNPYLMTLSKIPIAPGVEYHSIIGDRGKNDSPNSTDGIVPYWSSHMNGAESETIVPTGHLSYESPLAVKELDRVLRQHRR